MSVLLHLRFSFMLFFLILQMAICACSKQEKSAIDASIKTYKTHIEMHRDSKNEYFNKSEDHKYLFLPFGDLTNGKSTYEAGRFLDLPFQDDDIYDLDFNLAYNPYCAYGRDDYVCPLPPQENRLNIAIPVGEKAFLLH